MQDPSSQGGTSHSLFSQTKPWPAAFPVLSVPEHSTAQHSQTEPYSTLLHLSGPPQQVLPRYVVTIAPCSPIIPTPPCLLPHLHLQAHVWRVSPGRGTLPMPRTGCRAPPGKEGLREHQAIPKSSEPRKQMHCKAQKPFIAVQLGTFSHQGSVGCLQGSSGNTESQCPPHGNPGTVCPKDHKATGYRSCTIFQPAPSFLPHRASSHQAQSLSSGYFCTDQTSCLNEYKAAMEWG